MVEEENKACFLRAWKLLHSRCVLKTLRGSTKRTISVSGGVGLLQMVSKSDTRQYAKEDAGSRRGVDYEFPHGYERGTGVNEDTRPQKGGGL